jgi:hypothetical protein
MTPRQAYNLSHAAELSAFAFGRSEIGQALFSSCLLLRINRLSQLEGQLQSSERELSNQGGRNGDSRVP